LAEGKLHFVLKGKKLNGEWYLVRLREGNQWLLIKGGADYPRTSPKMEDTSAISGKTMDQLSRSKKVWQSNRETTEVEEDKPSPTRHPEKSKATAKNRSNKPFPKMAFVEPMKARLLAVPPPGRWIYEIKFDGYRALALKQGSDIQLISRNEKSFNEKFGEIVKSVGELDVADAILDGEIVALDPKGRSSFQLLQAFELSQEQPPLFYYVFDLLRLNGKDLRSEPVEERKSQLEKLIGKESSLVRYSASLTGDVKKLLPQVSRLGLEGLIGKREGSVYESGSRSGAWIKLQIHQEQEMVIGGYSPPGGSRQHFGALLVGFFEKKQFIFAGKVGTGFNDKLLRELHDRFKEIEIEQCPFSNLPEKKTARYGQSITVSEMKKCHWLQPELVCQVKFAEWTRDSKLRQPVFLGLREDKAAEDVVRERAAQP
jgi:bifunctional non-homologous end joining protein LigD